MNKSVSQKNNLKTIGNKLKKVFSRSVVFSIMLSFIFVSVIVPFVAPQTTQASNLAMVYQTALQSGSFMYEIEPDADNFNQQSLELTGSSVDGLQFQKLAQTAEGSNSNDIVLPEEVIVNDQVVTVGGKVPGSIPDSDRVLNINTTPISGSGQPITFAQGTSKGAGTDAGETKGAGTNPSKGSGSSLKNKCGNFICNPLGSTSTLDGFLEKLLKAVNVLAAMAVTFFIIYAGFLYVTAMGDPKKIESAHATLKWTVIGAAILFGAQVIASVIKNTVTELVNVK